MSQPNLIAPESPHHNVATSSKPTRIRYRVLAIGCALALLTYIHRQSFVRAMPVIQRELDFNKEQFGYLASAFLVAYGIFQVPWGLWGDRVGARNLLTLMVLGWSLITGATALTGALPHGATRTLVALLGIRFLFGMFQAGGFPLWARVTTDWTPVSERGSAQGTIWTFSRVGGAVGPYLFLWLFQFYGTWTTPLWLLGSVGILWCAAFWPWFRNLPSDMKQVNAAERELIETGCSKALAKSEPIPWSLMFRSVNVWGLCLMYGFVGFAGNFITQLLPMYLDQDRQLPEELTTRLTSLPLALGIVSCAVGGYLSDWISRRWGNRKWGRRCNGAIGLLLAGLTILAVPHAGPTWLLALLLSASFFCNDLNIGPAWAACADVGGRYAGTISGAMNMTGQFFGAAGMALAGRMLQREQADLLFIIFACSYGLGALCWLAVDVTKPLQKDH